ncbi:hypothetical protein DBR46_11975 [Pseudomonas sp. KBW05]|nr:hypothetical protein DBR46_11975 [Pseudomonas sp. KBW05]
MVAGLIEAALLLRPEMLVLRAREVGQDLAHQAVLAHQNLLSHSIKSMLIVKFTPLVGLDTRRVLNSLETQLM